MTPTPPKTPGFPLPSHRRHGSAAPRGGADHCEHGGTKDPVCVLDLNLTHLALVGSLRAWVAPLLRPGVRHPDWRGPLLALRAPAAAVFAWHRLLSAVSAGAARPIEVRCPACLGLSPDEARLLRAVGALGPRPDGADPAGPAPPAPPVEGEVATGLTAPSPRPIAPAPPVEGEVATGGRAVAEAELGALLRPEARPGALAAAAELAAALAAAGLRA